MKAKPIKELLSDYLKGSDYKEINETINVNKSWNKIVGKTISKNTEITSIKKETIKKWKKLGIEFPTEIKINQKTKAALISPDGKTSPKFLVFENYEKVLKWNRSLRFGISVCKLASMIKNDI